MLGLTLISNKIHSKNFLSISLKVTLFLAFMVVIFLKLLINELFFASSIESYDVLPPLFSLITINFIVRSFLYILLVIFSVFIFYKVFAYLLENYVTKTVFYNTFSKLEDTSYDNQENFDLKGFNKNIAIVYTILIILLLLLSISILIITYSPKTFIFKFFQSDSLQKNANMLKLFLFGDIIIGILFYEISVKPIYLFIFHENTPSTILNKINFRNNNLDKSIPGLTKSRNLHTNESPFLEIKMDVFPYRNSLKNYMCLFNLFLVNIDNNNHNSSRVLKIKKDIPKEIINLVHGILEETNLDVFIVHPLVSKKIKIDQKILAIFLKDDFFVDPTKIPRSFLHFLNDNKLVHSNLNILKFEKTEIDIEKTSIYFREWLKRRAMYRVIPLLIVEPIFLVLLHLYLGTFRNIILLFFIMVLIIPTVALTIYAINSFPFDSKYPIESSCNYISKEKLSKFNYNKGSIIKNKIYTFFSFALYGIIISTLLLSFPFPDFNLSTNMDKVNQIHIIHNELDAVFYILIIILFFGGLSLSFMYLLIFTHGRNFGYSIWAFMIFMYQYGGITFSFAYFAILSTNNTLLQVIDIAPVFIGSLSLLLLFRMEKTLVNNSKTSLEWRNKFMVKTKS